MYKYAKHIKTERYGVSSNLVGINFQYSLYIPFFASWKTITYKCWHV